MQDLLKRINWKSLVVNILIYVVSTVLSQFGIGCYYGCGLGTDPISVFVDGLHGQYGLSYGTISTICYVVQTILIFLFERKYLGIGTLIGTFIGGPLLDYAETFVRVTFPQETTSLTVKAIILLVALITTGIGYALSIACDLGIGPFQFWPIWFNDIFHLDLKYTQIISDAIFFLIGWILGGTVGLGTFVGVFLTGYVLEWTLSKIDGPIKKLGPIVSK